MRGEFVVRLFSYERSLKATLRKKWRVNATNPPVSGRREAVTVSGVVRTNAGKMPALQMKATAGRQLSAAAGVRFGLGVDVAKIAFDKDVRIVGFHGERGNRG
jgi:hypothetical protein